MTTNYPNSKLQACCFRCPIEALKMLSKPGATEYDTAIEEPVAEDFSVAEALEATPLILRSINCNRQNISRSYLFAILYRRCPFR